MVRFIVKVQPYNPQLVQGRSNYQVPTKTGVSKNNLCGKRLLMYISDKVGIYSIPHAMSHDALLVLLKWIHLMATVAWIGGMFTNFFIYMPVLGKTLEPPVAGKLMGAVMKRFRVMVYISMAVFLSTGILMAYLHPDAVNTYASKDLWIFLLILKVIIFIVMVILAIVAFEVLAPRVARIAAGGPSTKLRKAQKSQRNLAMAGFLMGMIILIISAAL
jgi:uncharacterized membrane protein